MNNYVVYKHVNKINNKMYIGITKQIPQNRWGNNGRNYKKSCPRFWSAITKYGWDNFEHLIIAENLNRDDACKLEIKLIAENKTQDKDFGYNILEGGSAPKLTEEIRHKMSLAMRGNKNGLGHKCSKEKAKKISEAQKGKVFSNETRLKMSIAKKGKRSQPCSEEKKKKISDSHKKTPIYCVETQITYKSIQSCAKILNIEATTICACCKGRIKSTHGYHFHYSNDI